MNLVLTRKRYNGTTTIGDLAIDGAPFCHTLEDTVRPAGAEKVFGKTAIPAGRYTVTLSMSNRFKRVMPEILDVPGFAGVRMHGGNTAADTEGCIIVAANIVDDNTVQGTMEKQLTALLQQSAGNVLDIIDTNNGEAA